MRIRDRHLGKYASIQGHDFPTISDTYYIFTDGILYIHDSLDVITTNIICTFFIKHNGDLINITFNKIKKRYNKLIISGYYGESRQRAILCELNK